MKASGKRSIYRLHACIERMLSRGPFTMEALASAVYPGCPPTRWRKQRVRRFVRLYAQAGYLRIVTTCKDGHRIETVLADQAEMLDEVQRDARDLLESYKRQHRSDGVARRLELMKGVN
jgi:hypothetical protein